MKKTTTTILFLTVYLLSITAQREMTWWYFGRNTGLDFTEVINGNTTVPAKVNGPIWTAEGCFTISDYQGNFLMASDGITVYSKDHSIMDEGTGLKGDPSASQSGIIIPRPDYQNQFYIVTIPNRTTTHLGLNYSIVDLNENGGYGKVTDKNIPLNLSEGYDRSEIYENIASVQHTNGVDYWLLHRSRKYFFAWLVTKDGIDPDPKKSSDTGYDPGGHSTSPNNASIGNMKFSRDGSLIGHAGHHGVTLGKFNASTGEVTGISNIKATTQYAYSCEFSPDGRYLYFTKGWEQRGVYRLDTNSDISLQTPVLISNKFLTSGLQLGPDDKLYGFDRTVADLALWSIDNPNAGGSAISVHKNFFDHADFYSAGDQDAWNLPTFTTSTFRFENLEVYPPEICARGENSYMINVIVSGSLPISLIEWDFGDGTIINDTDFSDQIHTVKYTYKKRGSYMLKITPYRDAAKTQPLTDWIITKQLRAKSCRIPVNHNLSVTGIE